MQNSSWLSFQLIMLMLVYTCAGCQQTEAEQPPPSSLTLHTIEESRIDTEIGEIVKTAFDIINESSAPIEIESISGDCSCTVATLDPMLLLPDQTAKVTVTINTRGKSAGTHNLSFVALEKNGDPHVLDNAVTINCRSSILIDKPVMTISGNGTSELTSVNRITLLEKSLTPGSISIQVDNPSITAALTIDEATVNNGESPRVVDLVVGYQLPKILNNVPFNKKVGHVTLLIDHIRGRTREFRIPITVSMHAFVRWEPTNVFIGTFSKSQPAIVELTAFSGGGEAISIQSIDGPSYMSVNILNISTDPLAKKTTIKIALKPKGTLTDNGVFPLTLSGEIGRHAFQVEIPCLYSSGVQSAKTKLLKK